VGKIYNVRHTWTLKKLGRSNDNSGRMLHNKKPVGLMYTKF